jgi:hypothetical protein
VEDSNVMLDRVGTRTSSAPGLQPDPEGEVIALDPPEQDLAGSFVAYRKAVEFAEAARQRAIVAALAGHRRTLDDIEAAYRRDVAAAQCRYSQRNGQRAVQAARESLPEPSSHAITRRLVP